MAEQKSKKESPLDKLKKKVSPGSTAGKLRDRKKEVDKKLKKAGA